MKGSKYLACLLASGLALSLLVGCSAQNSGTVTETTVVMSESIEDTEDNFADMDEFPVSEILAMEKEVQEVTMMMIWMKAGPKEEQRLLNVMESLLRFPVMVFRRMEIY